MNGQNDNDNSGLKITCDLNLLTCIVLIQKHVDGQNDNDDSGLQIASYSFKGTWMVKRQ